MNKLNDVSYIRIALELAKKGRGLVYAAPLIGVVIVKKEKILSASFNGNEDGGDCFISAINNAKSSLEGAVLYSNIEPFNHDELDVINNLVNAGIGKVVVGVSHPDPEIVGKGIKELKKNNVEVVENVLHEECTEVNKFFFNFIKDKRPYVTLKIASTLDGKIADHRGNSKWITSVESRSYVHELRNVYDAVLVGRQTVKADDPQLNVRLVEGRDPKRIVLDSKLSLSLKCKLLTKNENRNVIIITSEKSRENKKKIAKLREAGAKIIFVKENDDGSLKLRSALKKLAKEKITSILVEGGGKVHTSFIRSKLFDDMVIFFSPKLLGKGMPIVNDMGIDSIGSAYKLKVKKVEIIGEDAVVRLIKR